MPIAWTATVARSFIDTNLLLYCDDRADPHKQQIALQYWTTLRRSGEGVLSIQVLQEYYRNAVVKIGLEPAFARRRVEQHSRFQVVIPSVALVLGAIDLTRLVSVSFWDALIVEAARSAACELLLSEDLQHGQVIAGVRVINPFLAG
ncbi:MAG TPA: PIN domain-containing protein [Xanthomonadales bacterium]|nr:PIN domain-containing protein [Xanthomonadales bacterium]